MVSFAGRSYPFKLAGIRLGFSQGYYNQGGSGVGEIRKDTCLLLSKAPERVADFTISDPLPSEDAWTAEQTVERILLWLKGGR